MPILRTNITNPSWIHRVFGQQHCPFCDSVITQPDKISDHSYPSTIPDHLARRSQPLPICKQCYNDLPWCTEPGEAVGERSAFYYFEPVRQYILAGKGSKQLDKLHLLGRLSAIPFLQSNTPPPEAILPIPLHQQRLRQRGFNQSIELIRPLARQLKIPLLTDHVYRNRNTGEQKGLTAGERRHNMQQAFSIRKTIKQQHIAIFDDVITTGATCSALKALLLENGVKKVEIWSCATTKQ